MIPCFCKANNNGLHSLRLPLVTFIVRQLSLVHLLISCCNQLIFAVSKKQKGIDSLFQTHLQSHMLDLFRAARPDSEGAQKNRTAHLLQLLDAVYWKRWTIIWSHSLLRDCVLVDVKRLHINGRCFYCCGLVFEMQIDVTCSLSLISTNYCIYPHLNIGILVLIVTQWRKICLEAKLDTKVSQSVLVVLCLLTRSQPICFIFQQD